MTSEWLALVQQATVLLSVALLAVLALRGAWRRCFGAANVMLLWLSVPATLLALFVPAPVRRVEGGSFTTLAAEGATPPPTMPGTLSEPVVAFSLSELLVAGWLAGAVVLTAYLALSQWRYRRSLGRLEKLPDGSYRSQFIHTGPALVGALRPRIVVPADFHQRYTPRQQSLILSHERCHLRRGDAQLTLLACVVRCLFWFNPLVHLASTSFRIDQELACDAAVVRAQPGARREYAEAMVSTHFAPAQPAVGCTWLTGDPLRRRVTMLYTRQPGKIQLLAGTVLALSASTAAAVGAWSSQDPQLRYLAAAAPQLELATMTTSSTAPEPPLPKFAAQVTAPSLASVAARHGRRTGAALAPPAPSTERASTARSAAASAAPAVAPKPAPAPAAEPPSSSQAAATVDVEPARLIEASRPSFPSNFNRPELVSYPGMTEAERPGPDWQPDGWIWEMRVRVALDETGAPIDATIAQNDFKSAGMVRRYERLATRAVKSWRYEPARIDGEEVPSEILMAFHFDTSMSRPARDDSVHPNRNRTAVFPQSVSRSFVRINNVYISR